MFKMLIVIIATVWVTLSLSSCGTVAGLGDDIKTVAKWSEKKMTEEDKPVEQDSGWSGVETIPVESEEVK